MKILVTILAAINGGFMLIDGLYVLVNGKYIGPEKPGPWAYLFSKMNIDVFKVGPLFIIFGLAWLTWLYLLWSRSSRRYSVGAVISILTLWYLPVGTVISLIILLVLTTSKKKI
jgi:hypothetical protein